MQPLQTVQTVQAGQTAEPAGSARTRSVFMTVNEAAAVLRVDERHIRRALQAGLIPGFKFGDAYRVFGGFVDRVLTEVAAGKYVVIENLAVAQVTSPREGAA